MGSTVRGLRVEELAFGAVSGTWLWGLWKQRSPDFKLGGPGDQHVYPLRV